jgi:hypothetical protein
MATGL